MAASRGRMLAVTLLTAGLSWAAAQSIQTCDINPNVTGATVWTNIHSTTEDATTLKQVVQWCRYAERGPNSGGNTSYAERAWGSSTISAPGSYLQSMAGFFTNQYPSGVSSGALANATCKPTGTAAAGDLDGPGGGNYRGASPACSRDEADGGYNPTSCQTDDGWGTLVEQCVVPGDLPDPTNPVYPTTFSMLDTCNATVLTYDLVNKDNTDAPAVGQILLFKDYTDTLYMTVVLNATYRVIVSGATPTDDGNNAYYFNGQYLHAQPPLDNTEPHSGYVSLWTGYSNTPTYQYQDMLVEGNTGLYSCFTYKINTKALCNPATTTATPPETNLASYCKRNDNMATKPDDVINAQTASQLFFNAKFLVTKLHMIDDAFTTHSRWDAMGLNATGNGNYSSNLMCPHDTLYPQRQLLGCGCYDLNRQPPVNCGYNAQPGTMWLVPKGQQGTGTMELVGAGIPAHCEGLPRPSSPPPGTSSPPPGTPSPSPSPGYIASPIPSSPVAAPLFNASVDSPWYSFSVQVILDPEFYTPANMPFAPSQLVDSITKTFTNSIYDDAAHWFPYINMTTSTVTTVDPLTYDVEFYMNQNNNVNATTDGWALQAAQSLVSSLTLFIWYAGIPCGANIAVSLGKVNPLFPSQTFACFATDSGVVSLDSLCLKPKGRQLCVTPTPPAIATPGQSPYLNTGSPAPEIEIWPTPDHWYEFWIKTAIRASNGLQDLATMNREGTVNKVVLNICPYFKTAVLEALTRVGASQDAYIMEYGDQYNGCGDVRLSKPADNSTPPVYVYLKAFLNVSSTQFDKLRKKFAYAQSRLFTQKGHILCGSNLTWVDTVTDVSNPTKVNVYTQHGLPWLQPTYSPLSCKVTVGL